MTEDQLPDVYRRIQAAKRKATPIITLDTPDQLATAQNMKLALSKYPILQVDFSRGFTPINELGTEAMAAMDNEDTAGDPIGQMNVLATVPDRSVILMQNADAFINDIKIATPILNLRDMFKKRGIMLVLMGQRITVPEYLAGHVVSFDEPLPNEAQMRSIIQRMVGTFNKVLKGNGDPEIEISDELLDRCVDALIGLPPFPAEQLMAMSLSKDGGVDFEMLWEGKRQQLSKTKGLSVWRNCSDFSRIGGHAQLKDYTGKIMRGRRRPRLVVWLDEIEKTGLGNSGGDLSGTDNDQHGQLLSFIEDNQVFLQMYLGPAGTGKSEFVKAIGGEFDVTVIRLDLGAVKGEGLVGQAQNEIRHALKVIEAMGGKDAMWCGTSNSIAGLSDAMKSRCRGIWFYDLPTKEERANIWRIQMERYGLEDTPPANDEGAVGRDIAGACDEADRIGISLEEAWESIIPGGVRGRKDIANLRREANGTYRSTVHTGPYRMEQEIDGHRAMEIN